MGLTVQEALKPLYECYYLFIVNHKAEIKHTKTATKPIKTTINRQEVITND